MVRPAAPVLLLHAAGRTPQMWQSQVEAIATLHDEDGRGVSALAPWLAGLRPGKHAELSLAKAADEVLATMDRNGIETARLVGHQLGAMVALQVASTEPSMVAGLVLSGALAAPSAMTLRLQRAVIRLLPNRSLAESGASRADLLKALDIVATADFGKHLNRITAPALIIAGKTDPVRLAARQLAEDLPNGSYQEIPDAGAEPSLETPESFNRLLLDFLKATG